MNDHCPYKQVSFLNAFNSKTISFSRCLEGVGGPYGGLLSLESFLGRRYGYKAHDALLLDSIL